jgi:hypothetical protein
VLEQMPAGYIDLLAAELGDYGASTGHNISKDPSNPDMVVISWRKQISALERMNWQGFSSGDLGIYES